MLVNGHWMVMMVAMARMVEPRSASWSSEISRPGMDRNRKAKILATASYSSSRWHFTRRMQFELFCLPFGYATPGSFLALPLKGYRLGIPLAPNRSLPTNSQTSGNYMNAAWCQHRSVLTGLLEKIEMLQATVAGRMVDMAMWKELSITPWLTTTNCSLTIINPDFLLFMPVLHWAMAGRSSGYDDRLKSCSW